MSDFTNYLEGLIRDWLSQGTDMPAAPGTLEVSLHTADPGESPDGSTEVSAADYSRASTTAGTDWETVGENGFENASEIDFGTTSNDWGTITHFGLVDGSGNWLVTAAVSNAGGAPSGVDVSFPAGTLVHTID